MKKLVYLFCFMFVGASYAQVIDQDRKREQPNRQNTEMRMDRASYYDIKDPSDDTFNNENFRFIPNDRGDLTVSQMQNGTETEIGNLRRTTANGYYIITSKTDPNNVSIGRFDNRGNFRIFRYDSTTERVLEEDYNISSPRNIRGQNQSDTRRNNPDRDSLKVNKGDKKDITNQGLKNRNTSKRNPMDKK